ncbi:hypothetical protein ACHAW6_006169, partial [Cyclotella cf. meneghiniana]
HCCFGHLSCDKLEQLTRNGEIPKKLAKCPAMMHQLPLWCHDQSGLANKGQQVRQASLPGNKARRICLSKPNNFNTARFCHPAHRQADHQLYKGATIFVDHFSGLRYIHMMTNTSSDEKTWQSKLLNNSPLTILSPLNTTMLTMASLLTMSSSATAHNSNNDSPTTGL